MNDQEINEQIKGLLEMKEIVLSSQPDLEKRSKKLIKNLTSTIRELERDIIEPNDFNKEELKEVLKDAKNLYENHLKSRIKTESDLKKSITKIDKQIKFLSKNK